MSKQLSKDIIPKKNISQKQNVSPTVTPRFLESKEWLFTYVPFFLPFLLAFIFYGNTLFNGYALDDYMVILDNAHTKAGLKGIKLLLTKDSMHGIFGDAPYRPTLSFYRPLSYITFAIEYHFFGPKSWVGHLVNVLLYGLTGIVIFLFLKRLIFPHSSYLAIATTVLFVIHPIHVEVVANIKGRDEILAFLLVLLSGYFTLSRIRENSIAPPLSQIIAAICFFLSLLAKENTIVFLVIFPLTAWFFSKATLLTILRTQIPLGLATVVYLLLRTAIIGWDLVNETSNVLNNRYLHASVEQAFCTKIYILLFFYLKLLFWPYPQFWDYGYNAIPFRSLSSLEFWVALLLNAALLIWAIFQIPKRQSPIAYAILFYYIALALVSNLFINLGGFVAERFLYQASLGFCLAIVVALDKVKPLFGGLSHIFQRPVLGAAIVSPILIFTAFLTITRNSEWKDNTTLFIADMRKGSGSAAINRAGASELITLASNTPDSVQKKAFLTEALAYLYRSRDTLPNHIDANLELFRAYVTMNDWQKALPFFEKARSIKSDAPRVIQNAQFIASKFSFEGNQLVTRAATAPNEEKFQWVERAVHEFQRALHYFPNWQPAIMGIGNAYFQIMQLDSVEKYYFLARSINPSDSALQKNIALLYSKRAEIAIQKGESTKALEFMQKAVEVAPFQAVNWENLGYCYVQVRQFEKAVAAYEKAVSLEPTSAQRWYNLGYGYFMAGKKEKAREAWNKTLQIMPNHPQAIQGLKNL
ncbi:MAG: tetratricopeptide repeat protein [Bacteroidia bacterium]|nr:tetratricopeptide repeat protein [Bacteroidia bacterium]